MLEVVPLVAESGEVCSVCHARAYRPKNYVFDFAIQHAPMCQQVFELQTLLKNQSTVLDELIQGIARLEPLFATLNNRVSDSEDRIEKIEARLNKGSPFA